MTHIEELFGKNLDVFIEGLTGADIGAGHAWFTRGARGQLTLFEDQVQQGEQRVTETSNVT